MASSSFAPGVLEQPGTPREPAPAGTGRMGHRTPERLRPTALLIALALAAAAASPAAAHQIKQLKVVVNQIDHAVPANRQATMNAILEQCDKYGFRIRVTFVKLNLNQDPRDPNGRPLTYDGHVINDAGIEGLRDVAMAGEVKRGGFKFWAAKTVAYIDPNIGSVPVNGVSHLFSPYAIVREQSGIDGDETTWVHEMAHGLGLDHVTDPNGSEDGGDPNNLMYFSRRRADGSPRGGVLDNGQCSILNMMISGRSPATEYTLEQQSLPKGVTKQSTSIRGSWGKSPPVHESSADLAHVTAQVDENVVETGASYLSLAVRTNGPRSPTARYNVWLDLDNNPATGAALDHDHDPNTPPLLGFDATIEMTAPSLPSGSFTLFSLPGPTPLLSGTTNVADAPLDAEGHDFGAQIPPGTSILMRVLRSVLESIVPLASRINFLATSDEGSLHDFTEPDSVETFFTDLPVLTLGTLEANPLEWVELSGVNFAHARPVSVLFDDVYAAGGTTTSSGTFTGVRFWVPSGTQGDCLVDAFTDDGSVAVAVLRVGGIGGLCQVIIPTFSASGLVASLVLLAVLGSAMIALRFRRKRPIAM